MSYDEIHIIGDNHVIVNGKDISSEKIHENIPHSITKILLGFLAFGSYVALLVYIITCCPVAGIINLFIIIALITR